jgi:hypothetical protein
VQITNLRPRAINKPRIVFLVIDIGAKSWYKNTVFINHHLIDFLEVQNL